MAAYRAARAVVVDLLKGLTGEYNLAQTRAYIVRKARVGYEHPARVYVVPAGKPVLYLSLIHI